MNFTRLFWLLSVCMTLIRLAVIGHIGLSGDEAHYWGYTQHLELSYFDHPPLIAWVIKFSTIFFGNTEFAVRLPTVLMFFAASIVIFNLAKRLYDERVAFWSIVILNIVPLFSFLGAVLTVPDAPLALFWALFAAVFHRIVTDNRAGDKRWYLLGLLVGAGLLSKYNAVLLPVSAGLFLLLSPRHRHFLRTKEPWLALLVALAAFSMVIVWNWENNWVSFGFQLRHGFGKSIPHFSMNLLGRCLGAQAGYISPLFFFLYWALVIRYIISIVRYLPDLMRASSDTPLSAGAPGTPALLLFSLSFPTLFLFNSIASFNEILPHWPAMGYLLLTIGVARGIVARWNDKQFRAYVLCAGAVALLLTVLVPVQALFKPLRAAWFMPSIEARKVEDGVTRAEKVDVTNELYGWEKVGAKIAEMSKESPQPFIFSHRHYVSSQLAFYTPLHPRIYTLSERIDAYDLWQRDLSQLNGRDGLFVTNDYFYLDPRTVFPFAGFDAPVVIDIYRNGTLVRKFWITRCRRFDLSKLPASYTTSMLGERNVLSVSLIRLDHRLFWFINKSLKSRPLDLIMGAVSAVDVALGLNTGLIVLLIMVALVLWLTRREKFWPEFMLAIAIIAVGGIVVNVLKDIVGRSRPPALFGAEVNTFSEIFYKGSFPSGHSQIAFSVATYLTSRIKKYWWAFFLFAFFIAFSRIYNGVHFPSDVVAGGFIGCCVALIMIRLVKI